MKLARFSLIGLGALVVLLVVAVSVAFTSGFQTWAARRALAAQPGMTGTIGSVSAGLKRIEVKDARIVKDGAILTLPSMEAHLPLYSAGVKNKVTITRLVAKGWVLDLSKITPSASSVVSTESIRGIRSGREAVSSNGFSFIASAFAAVPVPEPVQVFRGIFTQLQLPVDLTLDGVELEGEVILPAPRGKPAPRVKTKITGGGLAAGREGIFAFAGNADSEAGVAPISAQALQGTLAATMDTPRTFTRLAVKAEASASGTQFPRGVKLNIDAEALRDAGGESYVLGLVSDGKQLAGLRAAFPVPRSGPTATTKLNGSWTLNVRDQDVAPFAINFPIPAFEASGEGTFESDASFGTLQANGKLDATADNLAMFMPELAGVGNARVAAAFNLGRRGDAVRIERLTADISSASKMVAAVRALQTFEFNPKSGELTADPARDLVGISLQGVPLAWAKPFMGDVTLTGGNLTGELVASAREGGLVLRSKSPLAMAGVSVTQGDKPLLRNVDISLTPSADYTPQGWQAVLAPLAIASGGKTLLSFDGKAGQLVGADRAIKATGRVALSLPAVLAQPAAGSTAPLTAGDIAMDFSANLGDKQEVQAKILVTNLAADPKQFPQKLPTIAADLRLDRAADGNVSIALPLLVERDGRKSDLNLAGKIAPNQAGFVLDAHVSSTLLVVDDVQILALPFSSPAKETAPTVVARPDVQPAWAGISGKATLALKEIVYSETFRVADVVGTLRLDAGAVKFEGVRAVMGEGSEAKVDGGITFDAKSKEPYALGMDLSLREFDPAPLFRAMNPTQPPTVEGRFDVTSKLAGQGGTLADLGSAVRGDFQLASKGGVFRGLPVSVASKTELTSKIAAGVASLGNLATVLTGKSDKTLTDISNVAQAVAELTKFWQAISYDQLSIVLSRDASLNTVLKNFTLIAPEIRLTGAGEAIHQPGAAFLDEALSMELKLRARGHHADLLKYIGVIDAQPDALGYLGCTLPLKISGTLGKPDTSELKRALENIILEKTGVTDKASDLLNKLLGR